uniref:Uncharacterized protein n=1 Tax=Rhipicephalus zambeziensis TaxID=60191 RepID=A0A224YLX0_9ACAR
MSYHHVDCNGQSFEWERKGEKKSCPALCYYVTMESDEKSGKGNERSHRREIRRARFSNTFLFFFSVLCNKHCTLHIRLRSRVLIHLFSLKNRPTGMQQRFFSTLQVLCTPVNQQPSPSKATNTI